MSLVKEEFRQLLQVLLTVAGDEMELITPLTFCRGMEVFSGRSRRRVEQVGSYPFARLFFLKDMRF